MDDLRTTIFYAAAVIILVGLTLLFTRGVEPLETDPPPIKTATALAAAPTPTVTPTATPEPACEPTPRNWDFGYLPDAPITSTLAPPDASGERLLVVGTVYAADCETPLPDVLVEVWQADADGTYDRRPPLTYRAKLRTDAEGRYAFRTVKPGHYKVNRQFRPAHIHYRLTHPEGTVFATRLLFADDPYLNERADTDRDQTIKLVEESDQTDPLLQGQFDIVMPVTPPTSTLNSE